MENEVKIINNEYDFSNVIADIDSVDYLVKYCDQISKYFLDLISKDEEKNKMLKYDYQNWNYKKRYSDILKIYIKQHNYVNDLECKNYDEFKSAVLDGNLKNVNELIIKIDLSYKSGKNDNLIEHVNEFRISFKPYNIIVSRKSNFSEEFADQFEKNLLIILEKFNKVNTIFCTK